MSHKPVFTTLNLWETNKEYPRPITSEDLISEAEKLYNFIQQFPENIIILAHWGGGLLFYELMKEVKQISKNVFYDTATTSFLYNFNIFQISKRLVGSEKIIFGSDYPLLNPQRILKEMEILSKEEMENISYRNIKSILSI